MDATVPHTGPVLRDAATLARARRRRDRRRVLVGLAFLGFWIVGFLAFTVYPLAASAYYSFTDYSLFGAPRWVGLANYRHLTTDARFLRAVTNTVVFGAVAIPASIVLAIALALLLHKRLTGNGVYRAIVFAPSIVPAAATAAIWVWILNPQWGLLNGATRLLGLPLVPWLSDPGWAKVALLLMTLWMIGSDMVLYLAALQNIPKEYYEAAEIDGAGAWARTRWITLPHLTPVIFFHLINAMIWAFQYFSIPYIVGEQGRGKPAGSLDFYAIYLYDNAFNYLKMGYASAMACLMFVVVMAATLLVVRSSSRWVHYAR